MPNYMEFFVSVARTMPCPFKHDTCIVSSCPVWRWTDRIGDCGEGKGYCGANGQDISDGPKVWINGVLQR